MITLGSQITYTPPPLGGKTFQPVTTSALAVRFVDDPDTLRVNAYVRGVPKPLTLWSGAAYTAIGNWTQDQADAQFLEQLGDNPASVLEGLFQQ